MKYFFVVFFLLSCSQSRFDTKIIEDNLDSYESSSFPLDSIQKIKLTWIYPSHQDSVKKTYFLKKSFLDSTKRDRKDIMYYYQRLPVGILCSGIKVALDQREAFARKVYSGHYYYSKILSQNIKNGFIRARSCLVDSSDFDWTQRAYMIIDIALFRDKDLNDLIVLNEQGDSPRFLRFYEKELVWREHLTEEIFPEFRSLWGEGDGGTIILFKIPENGTQMIACRDDDPFSKGMATPDAFFEEKFKNHPEEIIRINWDNGKFVLVSDGRK